MNHALNSGKLHAVLCLAGAFIGADVNSYGCVAIMRATGYITLDSAEDYDSAARELYRLAGVDLATGEQYEGVKYGLNGECQPLWWDTLGHVVGDSARRQAAFKLAAWRVWDADK